MKPLFPKDTDYILLVGKGTDVQIKLSLKNNDNVADYIVLLRKIVHKLEERYIKGRKIYVEVEE